MKHLLGRFGGCALVGVALGASHPSPGVGMAVAVAAAVGHTLAYETGHSAGWRERGEVDDTLNAFIDRVIAERGES